METNNNLDFSLKLKDSLEEKESGCFDRLQNVIASHAVIQLLFRQLDSAVIAFYWTIFYEK